MARYRNASRKSAPRKRPNVRVGEPVENPHPHDVLCGRGGQANYHIGNLNYRALVDLNKSLYVECPKRHKQVVSKSIVETIGGQDPPGRFLEQDAETGLWYEIEAKWAVRKTSQALREEQMEESLQILGLFTFPSEESICETSSSCNAAPPSGTKKHESLPDSELTSVQGMESSCGLIQRCDPPTDREMAGKSTESVALARENSDSAVYKMKSRPKSQNKRKRGTYKKLAERSNQTGGQKSKKPRTVALKDSKKDDWKKLANCSSRGNYVAEKKTSCEVLKKPPRGNYMAEKKASCEDLEKAGKKRYGSSLVIPKDQHLDLEKRQQTIEAMNLAPVHALLAQVPKSSKPPVCVSLDSSVSVAELGQWLDGVEFDGAGCEELERFEAVGIICRCDSHLAACSACGQGHEQQHRPVSTDDPSECSFWGECISDISDDDSITFPDDWSFHAMHPLHADAV